MAEPQPPSEDRDAKPIGGELVLPAAALLFTLYYFSTIIDTPWTAQVSAFFVGSILIMLIVLFGIRTWRQMQRGEVNLRIGSLVEPRDFISKRLIMLALTIGYIYLVTFLGFTITNFLFLTLTMLLLGNGQKKIQVFVVSTVLALGGWLLFIYAFDTSFPSGPFENMMKGLL